MMQRAHSWQYLFNPATGYVQARTADGSFPPGPAFQASMLEPGGQLGFEEGNAVQYTWSVPQDLSGLARLMGGDSHAVGELNTYFSSLNAGRDLPFDWAGNEPSLGIPWEYDYFGAPWQTQGTVRAIVNGVYSDTAANEPGNDDLGAMSSWYVWAAVGMYPVTPGSADLALASPLFPNIVFTMPDDRRIVIHAPAASSSTPYVHALTISGTALPTAAPSCGPATAGSPTASTGWGRPWLPASIIRTGGTLTYGLSSVPDATWGADPSVSPPSFGSGRLPAVGYSTPSGGLTMRVGQPTTVQLGAEPAGPGASTVNWSATTRGLAVSPTNGSLLLTPPRLPSEGHGSSGCTASSSSTSPAATQTLTVDAATPGQFVLDIGLKTSDGTTLPPVVLDITVTG
jgi:hypothetical protein